MVHVRLCTRACSFAIVHTHQLVEVDLNPEKPPLDPGDPGSPYAFERGEIVDCDHPAVLDCPGGFVPVEN